MSTEPSHPIKENRPIHRDCREYNYHSDSLFIYTFIRTLSIWHKQYSVRGIHTHITCRKRNGYHPRTAKNSDRTPCRSYSCIFLSSSHTNTNRSIGTFTSIEASSLASSSLNIFLPKLAFSFPFNAPILTWATPADSAHCSTPSAYSSVQCEHTQGVAPAPAPLPRPRS